LWCTPSRVDKIQHNQTLNRNGVFTPLPATMAAVISKQIPVWQPGKKFILK
jgi:hypothetical protein